MKEKRCSRCSVCKLYNTTTWTLVESLENMDIWIQKRKQNTTTDHNVVLCVLKVALKYCKFRIVQFTVSYDWCMGLFVLAIGLVAHNCSNPLMY